MDINSYLEQFNFDIRLSHNARFMDQKVTPDVLCIIADCILNYISNDEQEFTTTDIWRNNYSNQNVMEIFGKTDVNNPNAKSEYDKFFQQPLKALSYAKILIERKEGNQNYFKIKNKELLKYISIKERYSLDFLNIYLEKVLRDSGIWYLFDNFFNNNTKDNFDILKEKYEEFIISNTPINGETEVRRIFTKVINPLSFIRKKHGTSGGRYSKHVIDRDELMYNRRNWRDVTKRKDETRDEYELRSQEERIKFEEHKLAYVKYNLNKAKSIVKDLHHPNSEVQDEFAIGEARDVHHIFMKSQYPEISTFLENLILLTPTQHFTKAHPSDTSIINKDYQLLCLLSKSDSIERYSEVYSKDDFLMVLKIGLNHNFNKDISYSDLKSELVTIYNS